MYVAIAFALFALSVATVMLVSHGDGARRYMYAVTFSGFFFFLLLMGAVLYFDEERLRSDKWNKDYVIQGKASATLSMFFFLAWIASLLALLSITCIPGGSNTGVVVNGKFRSTNSILITSPFDYFQSFSLHHQVKVSMICTTRDKKRVSVYCYARFRIGPDKTVVEHLFQKDLNIDTQMSADLARELTRAVEGSIAELDSDQIAGGMLLAELKVSDYFTPSVLQRLGVETEGTIEMYNAHAYFGKG